LFFAKLYSYFYSFALQGISKNDSPTLQQNTVAFYIALFSAIFGDLIFVLIYLQAGADTLALAVGANTVFLIFILFLSRYRMNFTVMRVLPLFSTTLVLAFAAAVLGERSGAENLLIATVGVSAAIFSDADRKWIVGNILLCFGALAIFKWGMPFFHSLPDAKLVFNLCSIEIFYYICQMITATTLIIVFLNLRHQQDAAVNELEERKAKMLHTSQLAALGEMAAGIAHEINNPLAIIHGRLYQIEMALNDSTTSKDKTLEYIQNSLTTIDRISRIMKAMRVISRDGTQDEYTPTNIYQILMNTLQLSEEKFRALGIQVDHSDLHQNLVCRAQEVSLGQVFLNLLNNSCDAIAHLSERWIRISSTLENGFFVIRFTDSGDGIPKDVIEKMFRPFFTTKSIGKGTGLGLSISLSILENHGGNFFYDHESKNTSFVLRLPIASESP
jgi:signal transduction histidine kinase